MKKHIIFAMSAVLALSFTSCKDDENVEVGQWNSSADYAVVSFVERSESIELDPTENTTYTLHMSRRNPELSAILEAEEERVNKQLEDTTLTDEQKEEITAQFDEFVAEKCDANLPAMEVPIVITGGADSIFTISSAKFEQGEWYGEYELSFPEAAIGTAYSVQYAVTDTRFVSYYSDAATASFSVSRVKWNSLGKAIVTDNFWFEQSTEAEIFQKDNDPNMFRIVGAMDGLAAAAHAGLDGNQSPYMIVQIIKRNDVIGGVSVTEDDLVYFSRTNTGYFHSSYGADVEIFHPADLLTSPSLSTYLNSRVVSYQEDGLPGLIQLAPYYYMIGVGGWNQTGENDIFMIQFPGYVAKYTAELNALGEEGDFEWQELYNGEFTSNQLGEEGSAKLYKGVCTVTTDAADSIFAATYGTPYVIEAPYAEGYDIYFFVKDGRIQIPREFPSDWLDITAQPLGIQALGMDVYAQINASSSSFTDREVDLNMTYFSLDSRGNIDKELGTSTEIVANIIWNEYSKANYLYNFLADDEPEWVTDYTVKQREDKPNMFRMDEWSINSRLSWTWNQTTNAVTVPGSPTGYVHPTYGMIYACDVATWGSSRYTEEEYPTYYDPETKTFILGLVYYCEAGAFGAFNEALQLVDGEASEAKIRKITAGLPHYFDLKATDHKAVGPKWSVRKAVRKDPKAIIAPASSAMRF